MKQSNRARKRTTAPPQTTDTSATALTGIVSNEQRLARKGTTNGKGTDTRVTTAGRILGVVGLCMAASALVALGVYGLLEYVGSRD